MTTKERNTKLSAAEAVAGDRDLIKALMKEALQEVLEGEMTESCLRLIRALCVETHETWLEDNRYLNMTFLAEQKKELLRLAA